jgi:adenylyl-sulfate kinase
MGLIKGITMEFGMSDAFVLWLTGLPASGKSEIAQALFKHISDQGLQVEVINSGKLRRTPLGSSLGFTKHDRETNVHRHAIAAKLLMQNNVIAIVSAVSPYHADRTTIRNALQQYIEVYVSTPPELCKKLDKTGNWQRAEKGEIENFTGISDPYEPPTDSEVTVSLADTTVTKACSQIIAYLQRKKWLSNPKSQMDSTQEIAKKLQMLGYSDID